jgi:6-pyruvoyltetrahydropterin/6-carboxytetrahydropterin synthase
MNFSSTKIFELGSCAFRQWRASSHCKFVHGYRLVAKLWFGCNALDDKNWVVDFGGLKELKAVFEKQFDHTLCISGDDPLLPLFEQLHASGAADLRVMTKGVGIERTAEWCFDVADGHVRGITNNRCWVDKVEVWEHDKNSAIVCFANDNVTKQNNNTVEINNVPVHIPQVNQSIDFLEQVKETSGVDLTNVIKNPPPAGGAPGQPRPANVGRSNVSTGYGNLFGGTSWGA